MPGKHIRLGVRLDDIHLAAAVALALGVTISASQGCPGAVELAGVVGAVGDHLGEVEGAVFAAREGGHVHIDGELLVEQGHHDVLAGGLVEEVDARRGADQTAAGADVVVHGEGVAGGGDAFCGIIGWLDYAVLCAGCGIGALGLVEVAGVAGLAGGGAAYFVDVAVFKVEDDGGVLLDAAAGGGAFPCWEEGVDFGGGGGCLGEG